MQVIYFIYLFLFIFFLPFEMLLLKSNLLYGNSESKSQKIYKDNYISNLNLDILTLSYSFPQMEKKTYYVIIYDRKENISGYIQSLFSEKKLTESLIFYGKRKRILLKEVMSYSNNLQNIKEKKSYIPIRSGDDKKLIDFSSSMKLKQKVSFLYFNNILTKTFFESKNKNYSINYSYLFNKKNNEIKFNFKYFSSKDGKYLEKSPVEKILYTYYTNGIKLEIYKIDLLKDSKESFSSGIIMRTINEKTDLIESIVKINQNYIPYRYVKYVYSDSDKENVKKILVYKVLNYNQRWNNNFSTIPQKNLFLMYTFLFNYNLKDNEMDISNIEEPSTHFIKEIPIVREKLYINPFNESLNIKSNMENISEKDKSLSNSNLSSKKIIENQIQNDKNSLFNNN